MDDVKLLEVQENLQREASEVLAELNLLDFLSQFGEPTIVGSLARGLMAWPDIDIELEKEIDEKNYWKTVQYIFHQPNLKGTSIMDYRNSVNLNTPKGLYIEIQYYGKQKEPWKIDIWFIPPRQEAEENIHEWLKNSLKEEHRLPILRIKSEIWQHPKYRKEIFSLDIYQAVIDQNVKTYEEFVGYLKKIGKNLRSF